MKTSSCKAKGRRLQQDIRDVLLENFIELEPDDVRSTGMGQQGIDIQLSPAAKKQIPFAIEAKNQEGLSIWQCMVQAETNADKEKLKPALVFKRNRSKTYTTILFSDFVEMIKELHELKELKKGYDRLQNQATS
jgi:hypothetical protein